MAELRGKAVLIGTVVMLVLGLATAPGLAQKKGARAGKKKAPAKTVKRMDLATAGQALGGGDVARATQAATDLGANKSAKALELLLDALAMGADPKVATAALGSVAEFRSPKALDIASHYLGNRNRRVRAAAVTAVGSIDDSRAAERVLRALRDMQKDVRAAAADVIGKLKLKLGIEPLIALLKKGDEAPARALAQMADADLALTLGELIGVAPDAVLARTLGLILLRPDFKPENARVQVVRTLGKISGTESIEQLSSYIESVPENSKRKSRREAETIIEQRLTGGI